MTVDQIPEDSLRATDPGIAFVGHTRFSLYQPGSIAWQASNQSTFRTAAECRDHLHSTDLDVPVQEVELSTTGSLCLKARGGAMGDALRDSASAGAPALADVCAGGVVADPSEPDGISAEPDNGGTKASKRALEVQVMPNAETINERPWEQDEYRLAAERGRDRGRESCAQPYRDVEDGGV